MIRGFKFTATATLGLLGVSGYEADAAIVGNDSLDVTISANSSYILSLTGSTSITLGNSFSYAGSDSFGQTYYNKAVYAYSGGSATIGSYTVPAGTLISSAPSQTSTSLDSQQAYFQTRQTGGGYSYSCGKHATCYAPPTYSSFGSYSTNNSSMGSPIYLPASYVDAAGVRELGYLDLSIIGPFSNSSYGVTLNGYAFQTDGSPIFAGEPLSGPSPVPLPPSWALMASGFLGVAGCRQLMASRKRRQVSKRHSGLVAA